MSEQPGWVYFIREEQTGDPTQDLIKIGWSGNVVKRRAELQAYSDFPLLVLVCFPGTQSDEKRLHGQFSAARVNGEWFRPCAEILEAVTTGTLPSFPQGEFVPTGEKQKRLSLHWSQEWNEEMVRQAKQAAIARDLSLSAFIAEAVREKLIREKLARDGALGEKGKKR